jgi:hypothetical protein
MPPIRKPGAGGSICPPSANGTTCWLRRCRSGDTSIAAPCRGSPGRSAGPHRSASRPICHSARQVPGQGTGPYSPAVLGPAALGPLQVLRQGPRPETLPDHRPLAGGPRRPGPLPRSVTHCRPHRSSAAPAGQAAQQSRPYVGICFPPCRPKNGRHGTVSAPVADTNPGPGRRCPLPAGVHRPGRTRGLAALKGETMFFGCRPSGVFNKSGAIRFAIAPYRGWPGRDKLYTLHIRNPVP